MSITNLSAEPLGKTSLLDTSRSLRGADCFPARCVSGKVTTTDRNRRSNASARLAPLRPVGLWMWHASSPFGHLPRRSRPETLESSRESMRANKGSLGDLGGGNHFLDALAPYDDGPLYFLIHTGSRNESGHVDALIDQPAVFDRTFDQVVQWAADNRATIQDRIERAFGKTDLRSGPPSPIHLSNSATATSSSAKVPCAFCLASCPYSHRICPEMWCWSKAHPK